MKTSFRFSVLIAALAISIAITGCKPKPKGLTYIPGKTETPISQPPTPTPVRPTTNPNPNPGTGLPTNPNPNPNGNNLPNGSNLPPEAGGPNTGIKAADLDDFEGMTMNREAFKAHTVYFDFDKYNVKKEYTSNIEAVAAELKAKPDNKVLVEGHCDERGTEGYNLALGQRRADSVREYLANLGIDPNRVRTISYGEARPAVDGHDDAAYAKNRRGEFILLLPKQ